MSQLSTATTIARRSTTPKGAGTRELRVLTAADATGSPWFPVLFVSLLLAGLAGVLALNTAMARDSFEVGRLEARAAELSDTREALALDVNARSAPQHLAERARALGMVPADSAAFVDLEQGKVLGVAKPAKKPEGFSVGAAARATGGSAPAATSTAPAAGGGAPSTKTKSTAADKNDKNDKKKSTAADKKKSTAAKTKKSTTG
jgi:hypothetical protein